MKWKKLKLFYRGCCKLYQNEKGQYLVGINGGCPFVIPIIAASRRDINVIYYMPDEEKEAKTSFLIISDGSYAGASIIDLDNMYIIYTSSHKNTILYSHDILEKQIELNEQFAPFEPYLVKEIVNCSGIIRIFCVGTLGGRRVFCNHFSPKFYYPDISKFDFRSSNLFFEFIEKNTCFVIKSWQIIEYI